MKLFLSLLVVCVLKGAFADFRAVGLTNVLEQRINQNIASTEQSANELQELIFDTFMNVFESFQGIENGGNDVIATEFNFAGDEQKDSCRKAHREELLRISKEAREAVRQCRENGAVKVDDLRNGLFQYVDLINTNAENVREALKQCIELEESREQALCFANVIRGLQSEESELVEGLRRCAQLKDRQEIVACIGELVPSSNSEFVNDAESVREGLRRCAQLEDPREVAACVVEVLRPEGFSTADDSESIREQLRRCAQLEDPKEVAACIAGVLRPEGFSSVDDSESIREQLRRCAQLEDPKEVAACIAGVLRPEGFSTVDDSESIREQLKRCAKLEDPKEIAACIAEVLQGRPNAVSNIVESGKQAVLSSVNELSNISYDANACVNDAIAAGRKEAEQANKDLAECLRGKKPTTPAY